MKILVVNDRGGFFGGVEQNVADCAAGLSANGHEVFLAFGDVIAGGEVLASVSRGVFTAVRASAPRFLVRGCALGCAAGSPSSLLDFFFVPGSGTGTRRTLLSGLTAPLRLVMHDFDSHRYAESLTLRRCAG